MGEIEIVEGLRFDQIPDPRAFQILADQCLPQTTAHFGVDIAGVVAVGTGVMHFGIVARIAVGEEKFPPLFA